MAELELKGAMVFHFVWLEKGEEASWCTRNQVSTGPAEGTRRNPK